MDPEDDEAHQVDERGEEQLACVLGGGGLLEEPVQFVGVEGAYDQGAEHDGDGACWRNRSKTSPSRITAVPEGCRYPEERQQVITDSATLEWVDQRPYLACALAR